MKGIEEVRLLNFKEKGDERGQLVIVEGMKDIPFEIKRVFYMYGSEKGIIRGQHANKKSKFVLINISGNSKVKVDDGIRTKVYSLDRPYMGLYLPELVWKDMYDFSENSILLVLSSEYYDSNEYIKSYDEFLKQVR